MTRITSTLSLIFAVLLTAGVVVAGQSIAASVSKSPCVTGVDYESLTPEEITQFESN